MRFISPLRLPASRTPVVLVVAMVSALAAAATSAADGTPSATSTPARHASIVVRVPHPGGVVAGFGSVWVQSLRGHSIWRVAPDGRVEARLNGVWSPNPLGGPQTISIGFGSIWSLHGSEVVRIDPATDSVIARIPVTVDTLTMVIAFGSVWVTGNAAILRRIDPRSDTVTMRVPLGSTAGSMAVAGGALWLSRSSEAGGLDRIDPRTGRTREVSEWHLTSHMLGAFHRVWLTSGSDEEAPLDPATDKVARSIFLKGANAPIIGVAAGLGRIWLNAPRLVAVNPRTGRVASFDGAGSLSWQDIAGVAVLGHRVWLAAPRGSLIGVPVCWRIYCPATGRAAHRRSDGNSTASPSAST